MKTRLQKFIADCGYCSRRKAEELILNKRVKVNNQEAKIGMCVSEKDKVTVDNKVLKHKKKHLYILLNKPKGYVCTNVKNSSIKSIFQLVPFQEKLFVAGRLDKESRGLVILTNDGSFGYRTTHPSFLHEKEYNVVVDKNITKEVEKKLLQGVDIKEKTVAKIKSIEKIGNKKYKLVLTEGKNRQIRRSLGALSYTVLDIERVRINNYTLKGIKEGCWKEVGLEKS